MLRKPLKRAVSFNMAGIPERTASENSGLMTMSTVMMTPSDTAVSSVSAELIEPRRGIAENHSGLRFGGCIDDLSHGARRLAARPFSMRLALRPHHATGPAILHPLTDAGAA